MSEANTDALDQHVGVSVFILGHDIHAEKYTFLYTVQ